jgi:dihydrofolate reductase
MRKLIYALNVSLDGYFEGPDGDLSWSIPDEELHRHFNELDRRIDLHLYGRRLYENMAAFWPTAEENPGASPVEIEYARIWKQMPKVVFSKSLTSVGWNSRLVHTDAAREVRALKAQPGGDMSVAGAELAGSLMQLGLVDEYRVYIHPVVIGSGRPMFPPMSNSLRLELIGIQTIGSGVVLLNYRKP